MEISRMLTLSTAHISKETADKLGDQNSISLWIYDKVGYGWFIYIPDEHDLSTDIPDDLLIVVQFAKQMDIGIVCLDCDGNTLDQLPTYDW